MNSYIGRHAELYDIIYADKPYGEEAAFVHQCLQQYSIGTTCRLLELACGTGTHALLLEKLGYEVVGIDYSEDMLACARRTAAQAGSAVDFRLQDMRALGDADQPFDAAVCLFDSIGYVKTNGSLVQVLEGVHRQLRRDGLFVFEFWHAAAMVRSHDPVRMRRWSIPEGDLVRISETELDYLRQLATVKYTILELHHDGKYCRIEETQTNRYFLVQEMAVFLTNCGFQPVRWFAGFGDKGTIDEQTWHVLGIARAQ